MFAFPEMPGLYDLNAFAARLPDRSEFRKLKGLIRQIGSVGSALEDIRECQHYADLGRLIDSGAVTAKRFDQPLPPVELVGPIMSWAIVLYARATHSESRSRRTESVLDALNEEQRASHKLLIDLRNGALAHFGPGPDLSSPWSKDATVLRVGGTQKIKIYTPVRRQRHSRAVNEALRSNLPAVKDALAALRRRRDERFYDEFERLFRPNWRILKSLDRYPFDWESFFDRHPDAVSLVQAMMTGEGPDGFIGELF